MELKHFGNGSKVFSTEEELYWENKLRTLKMEIDQEVRARLEIEKHGLDAGRELEIRTDINNKHSAKKKMLLAGW